MTTSGVAATSDAIFGEFAFRECTVLRPSSWSISLGKRILDVLLAAACLLITLPLMLFAAFAVSASPGPIFFISERMGQHGKRIRVLKFRTMHYRKETGLRLTHAEDGRVTEAGRFLRHWKLDELPQFINVIRGEMSLVGPRPDATEFLNTLPIQVLSGLASLKPGITGAATLRFRNEETLLARVPESELASFYTSVLLPEKARLDLEYASRATMLIDLRLLLQTLLAVVR